MGIKILGPNPQDRLFQFVELPPGWTKKQTDHYMWSQLLDDRGRSRAGIFFKPEFYDRDAFVTPGQRFHVRMVDNDWRKDAWYQAEATGDNDEVLFRSHSHDFTMVFEAEGRPDRDSWKRMDAAKDAAVKEASDWLTTHYPNWQDPRCHWDDPLTPEQELIPARVSKSAKKK